jgi:hypothetical protein
MCEDMQVPLLAQVPLEPKLLLSCEKGECFVKAQPDSETSKSLTKIAEQLKKECIY